ncbi:MAG: PIN domain-containing protein [Polyangiaceae bacterium]|nr:PIN domain-containing protein [Polyangiaceae bacterium]
MRIVLDTNVLMSAIFWKGTPRKLLDAWQEGVVSLVASPDIVAEYERVADELGKRHPRSAELAGQIIQLLLTTVDMVEQRRRCLSRSAPTPTTTSLLPVTRQCLLDSAFEPAGSLCHDRSPGAFSNPLGGPREPSLQPRECSTQLEPLPQRWM